VADAGWFDARTDRLYLFCTWTKAFWPIVLVGRFDSLRSLENSAILVDQLPPPPPDFARQPRRASFV
jgi:hypothetical protein